MSFPARVLQAGARELRLDRPWLMGIVNASPDSFSDGDGVGDTARQLHRAADLVRAGADVIDVGGESGITGVPAVAVQAEIDRVVPLIRRITQTLDTVVSVDTYKPAVAAAAIEAGATIINDVSGLRDPALADLCAESGAALVIMHTRTPPKVKLIDPDFYDDVVGDVELFLEERIQVAVDRGVRREQLMLDPGPDFAKTPFQTVEVLRRLGRLHERFERPLLLAISRKDFIGAITGRAPGQRGGGTLAALGEMADAGAHMVRLHDVEAAVDYLAVRAVLRGEAHLGREQQLDLALRRGGPAPSA